LLFLSLTAAAPTPQDIEKAEQAQSAQLTARAEAEARGRAARTEEQRLAAERVAAAAQLRILETATSEAAGRVAELSQRQREAEARLAQRAAEMAPMLPVLERLAVYPVETLLAVPLPPEQAVRSLLVMGGISRQIEADAAALREAEAEAARLARETAASLPRLASAQEAQTRAAAALDQQIGRARAIRQDADDEAAEAARRAATEAARADSLRAALVRLEAERRAAQERARVEAAEATRQKHEAEAAAARRRQEALARPAGPGLAEARGGEARATEARTTEARAADPRPPEPGATPLHARLTAPVVGQVVRGWGDAAEAGSAIGITYGAAPSARVVAPCTGRVVFANPFRSYGLLLIVDCGGGWHAVVAGLERLDAKVGSPVRQGEPVGAMAGWDPRGAAARPTLYLELRRGGQAVDPAPYLRGRG
jgi:septal ring factor EnvC (AmiA/AmiB activator)